MSVPRRSKSSKAKPPKPAAPPSKAAPQSATKIASGGECGGGGGFRGRYVWQRRWFQTMLAVLVVFLVLSYVVPGVLGLLYAVRSVLVPVLIGLALAYIMNPVLRFAQAKLHLGRLAGTVSLMLLSLVMFAVIMITAVPTAIEQGSELVKTVQEAYPKYVDKLLRQIDATKSGSADSSDLSQAPQADGDTLALITAENPKAEPGQAEASPPPPGAAGGDASAANQPLSDSSSDREAAADKAVASGLTAEAEAHVSAGAGAGAGAGGSETEGNAAAGKENSLVEKFISPDRNRRLLELSVERLRGLAGSVIAGWAMQSLDVGVGLVGSAISFTSYLALSAVVIAFCFFFFSWKFDEILAWFVPFIPAESKGHTLGMLRDMDLAVSSFVRGRVIQSVIMTVLLVIGWWLTDVPYWFLLGVLTGVLNLVPFLPVAGWLLALVLTVMTALSHGGDFTVALILWPSVAYFAAQGLDGWVVEPIVQGKATNLDPLTVLLVVLVGGSLVGLLGMLLAIPLAACVKILAKEWVLPKLRAMAAEA